MSVIARLFKEGFALTFFASDPKQRFLPTDCRSVLDQTARIWLPGIIAWTACKQVTWQLKPSLVRTQYKSSENTYFQAGRSEFLRKLAASCNEKFTLYKVATFFWINDFRNKQFNHLPRNMFYTFQYIKDRLLATE